MRFGTVGITYKEAPISVRDQVSFSDTKKLDACLRLAEAGIPQAVILSTCNRSELYFCFEGEEELLKVKELYCSFVSPLDVSDYLFIKTDREAVEYLFEVAGGMDSLVLGEDQILGQVADAAEFARLSGSGGKEINKIFRDAVTSAKRLKTELKVSEHPLSLGYIGVKKISEAAGIAGKTAVVVGSGKMAELILEYLTACRAGRVILCCRNMERAAVLKESFPGLEVRPLAKRYEAAQEADILISATSAPHLLIRAEELRPQGPLLALDLALPRDIDPAVGRLPGVTLFDIDSLKETAEENRKIREELIGKGRKMMEADCDETLLWLSQTRVDGAIRSLNQRLQEIEADTCGLLAKKLSLDDHSRAIMEKIVRSGMKRLLREPILNLKKIDGEEEQKEAVRLVEYLFCGEEGKNAH